MSLDSFFTELDASIVGTSEPDPMGLLPIWTGYAGNLFKNRVNSRVGDLRAYTINLFHSWIVWRVRQDVADVDWDAHPDLSRFGSEYKPAFSRSLFVLLEKILLVGFCQSNEVDGEGILGLATARLKGVSEIDLRLHDTLGTVLIRQAQLGFSGAYRSSFSTWMRLLDPVTGHPLQKLDEWNSIGALFSDEFQILSDKLTALIGGFLKRPKVPITVQALGDIPDRYCACFGKREPLQQRFASYWLETLAMEKDELALLWKVSQEHLDLSEMELFQRAKALPEGADANAIGNICDVAPFLARVEEIFAVLRSPTVGAFDDAAAHLEGIFGKNPLADVRLHPDRQEGMLGCLPRQGIARRRLVKLFEIDSLPARDLVEQILSFHKEMVCELRRSEPWLEIVNDSWRCHVASGSAVKVPEPGVPRWAHDFYGGGFLRLARAIQEGQRS